MKQFELIETADGSRTIFVPELNETYHSKKGALNEARHVFIENGVHYLLRKNYRHIALLEVGYGTGLNALLTILQLHQASVELHYDGLERFPLNKELSDKMNYAEAVNHPDAEAVLQKMTQAEWGKWEAIWPGQHLRKVHADIHTVEFDRRYDLVFFDAFCFRAQEDMWKKSVFEKIYYACNSGAVLVTYASKGVVKRTMAEVGFSVEKLPGPLGKREMLRAEKI